MNKVLLPVIRNISPFSLEDVLNGACEGYAIFNTEHDIYFSMNLENFDSAWTSKCSMVFVSEDIDALQSLLLDNVVKKWMSKGQLGMWYELKGLASQLSVVPTVIQGDGSVESDFVKAFTFADGSDQ